MMSPWLIQTYYKTRAIQNEKMLVEKSNSRMTFFLSFPLMWQSRLVPSKHKASSRPFPSIFVTCAYSWPSSLKINSLFSASFSFFPLLRFLPPLPNGHNMGWRESKWQIRKPIPKSNIRNKMFTSCTEHWKLTFILGHVGFVCVY